MKHREQKGKNIYYHTNDCLLVHRIFCENNAAGIATVTPAAAAAAAPDDGDDDDANDTASFRNPSTLSY